MLLASLRFGQTHLRKFEKYCKSQATALGWCRVGVQRRPMQRGDEQQIHIAEKFTQKLKTNPQKLKKKVIEGFPFLGKN